MQQLNKEIKYLYKVGFIKTKNQKLEVNRPDLEEGIKNLSCSLRKLWIWRKLVDFKKNTIKNRLGLLKITFYYLNSHNNKFHSDVLTNFSQRLSIDNLSFFVVLEILRLMKIGKPESFLFYE